MSATGDRIRARIAARRAEQKAALAPVKEPKPKKAKKEEPVEEVPTPEEAEDAQDWGHESTVLEIE